MRFFSLRDWWLVLARNLGCRIPAFHLIDHEILKQRLPSTMHGQSQSIAKAMVKFASELCAALLCGFACG